MAPPPAEWRVRPLSPGDEPKILALHELVFGIKLSTEQWRWQFANNPFSRPIVYLAEAPDGTIVGHFSMVPIPVIKRGRPGLAALSIQSMVHPHYQRRGILKALVAAAASQLDADGIETGITFLNDNSLHAYTRHFGWTELKGPNFIYFTVLDCRGVAKKILSNDFLASVAGAVLNIPARLVFRPRRGASGRAIIRRVDRFDERVDGLWARFHRTLGCTVDRSARYLNWRLVDKPTEYSCFIAELGSELEGLVVTRTEDRFGLHFGYLVELLFDPGCPETGRQLVEQALDHLRGQDCSMATAVSAGSTLVQKTLRASGFFRLPRRAMPHGIHFCYQDRRGESRSDGADWYLSWSDHDVV